MNNLILNTLMIPSPEITDFYNFNIIGINSEIKSLSSNQFSHLILSEYEDKLNPGILKKEISKNREKYHIISVRAKTASIFALATRDGRIDAIWVDTKSNIKLFNAKLIKRLQEYDKLIFLDLSGFFSQFSASSLRQMLRVIELLKKQKVPIILSNSPQNEIELRSYRSLQAIARFLGLNNQQTIPSILIDRIENNTKKIEGNIIFSGIEREEEE